MLQQHYACVGSAADDTAATKRPSESAAFAAFAAYSAFGIALPPPPPLPP